MNFDDKSTLNIKNALSLYICTSKYIGGAELSLSLILKQYSKASSFVIIPTDAEQSLVQLFRDCNVEVIKLKIPTIKKYLNPFKSWQLYKKLQKVSGEIEVIIEKNAIEIIYANNDHSALISQFIVAKSKIWYKRDLSLPKFINKFIAKRHNKIIAVSHFVCGKCSYLNIPISICYSMVDIDLFTTKISKHEAREKLGIEDTCQLVINVGNGAEWKQQNFFVKIINELHSEYPQNNILGLIVGNLKIPPSNHLKQITLEYEQMKYIYAAADILVNTSNNEPLGRFAVEAIASGLPIVSVDGGGVEEIINLIGIGNIIEKAQIKKFTYLKLQESQTTKLNQAKLITINKLKDFFDKTKPQ